jgi:hypothetical protein
MAWALATVDLVFLVGTATEPVQTIPALRRAVTETDPIGIRMAMGARPRNVVAMVVGQGMALTLAGITVQVFRMYHGRRESGMATRPWGMGIPRTQARFTGLNRT